jgi:uncharacterized protein YkwD
MKNIITILLLILSITSYGQTKLDMLAFESLNKYRVENGVEPLIFDTAVWKAAQHHSVYLGENGYPYNYVCSSGHLELVLVNFYDRINHFGVKWVGTGAECVATWGCRGSNEKNVIHVINLWDSSPSHKEGLLKKDVTRVAISLVAVPWIRHKYGRTWEGVNYFATFLVVR